MSYENAPATKLLATNCACCRRPLLDARSAEIGMGPICRKRHGYDEMQVTDDARERANALINGIARNPGSPDSIGAISELMLLGFHKLVGVLTKAVTTVQITATDASTLAVRTPYSERFVECIRSVRGRRWDSEHKVWTVHAASKAALWDVLKVSFPGKLGTGPSGMFVIPQ